MDKTLIARTHIEAIIKLLLGNRRVKPGLAFLAGGPLTTHSQVILGQTAVDSATDLIHVAFRDDEAGRYTMSSITIFAPRDRACHIHTNCRLAQRRAARRAVLLPVDAVRGHFAVANDEIIQRFDKPVDLLDGGVERAAANLLRIIDARPNMAKQVNLFEVARS